MSAHTSSGSEMPVRTARNSIRPREGIFSNNYGSDQQRLQISGLHFDKFTTPATFACWKIRFKTAVCTCSQFPTEALHWIKEVEVVDSVDDLRIFVFCERNSHAKFLSLRWEDCFSSEPHHPQYPLQEKGQSGRTQSPERGPFLSWKTDRLCRFGEKCSCAHRQVDEQSSKRSKKNRDKKCSGFEIRGFGPPPFRAPTPSLGLDPHPFAPPPPRHPRKCPKLTVAYVGETVAKVGLAKAGRGQSRSWPK